MRIQTGIISFGIIVRGGCCNIILQLEIKKKLN